VNSGPSAITLEGIGKSYPGVRALDDVSLTIAAGEVLGLAGENGAGKSTLIKILSGIEMADDGRFLLFGQEARFRTPREAMLAGIALIPQEVMLARHLTVRANIVLGQEPGLVLSPRAERRLVEELMERTGFHVPLDAVAGTLSVPQQRVVEILHALTHEARIFIMDEPTASLGGRETEVVEELVLRLKAAGHTVIYVSHQLGEVLRLTDRVAVLRDGHLAAVEATEGLTRTRLAELMLGRRLDVEFPPRARSIGEPVLAVDRLSVAPWVEDVSFTVRAGEVVGLAGLMGSGRSTLARAIAGGIRSTAGTITLRGAPLRLRSPADAIAAGIVLVPEDRKVEGLILSKSVAWNIAMTDLPAVSPRGLMDFAAEDRQAASLVERLSIKIATLRSRAGSLSGGNQQKVSIAKWLTRERAVVILDEPTRGIDVGGKLEVFRLIEELAGAGLAVLLISSELNELAGMADRVLVMSQGRIEAELQDGFDEEGMLRVLHDLEDQPHAVERVA
jgi:ABC-type sugar transport system ATPase subunit